MNSIKILSTIVSSHLKKFRCRHFESIIIYHSEPIPNHSPTYDYDTNLPIRNTNEMDIKTFTDKNNNVFVLELYHSISKIKWKIEHFWQYFHKKIDLFAILTICLWTYDPYILMFLNPFHVHAHALIRFVDILKFECIRLELTFSFWF